MYWILDITGTVVYWSKKLGESSLLKKVTEILKLGNGCLQVKVQVEEFGQSCYELRIDEKRCDFQDDVVVKR